MANLEMDAEIRRILEDFSNADDGKLRALRPLIEQAAYERMYLRRLNEQAAITGLVKVHPNNPERQKALPVSAEIARHSATLTNILDKLMKHLAVEAEEDDGLGEYE